MDAHYDVSEAGNTLEQLAVEGQATSEDYLAKFAQNTEWKQSTEVLFVSQPKSWRLVKKVSMQSTIVNEEFVFTVRGVIVAKDLPPLFEKPSIGGTRLRFLRQGITLTGFGRPSFQQSIEAIMLVQEFFQRHCPEGKLETWNPGSHRGFPTLELSNRYFTPTRDAPNMGDTPFDNLTDPFGILEGLKEHGYVHGEDNTVQYFSREIDKDGNQEFVVKGPQVFKIGDIVEAQLSLIVVPLKDKQMKMLSVLHAIALLNTDFTQDAQRKRMERLHTPPTLKRKVGYGVTNKKARIENNEMEDVEE